MNVRVKRFKPRFMFIRNEKEFDEKKFIEDFSKLPLNFIYSTDDNDDKLDLFNSMFTASCLDRYAPLREIKVTRHSENQVIFSSIKCRGMTFDTKPIKLN